MDEVRRNVSVGRAVLAAYRAAEQLDDAAELVGVCDVLKGDLGDALAGNRIRVELVAVGEVGKDADLAAGIVTLNVGGRVLLGVAVDLRLTQRVLEGDAVVDHLGQDVVGGAVQNAADLVEFIGCEALEHRADDRDAAADGRLEHIVDAVLLRDFQQLVALRRDQLFVRGADALAGLEAAAGELISCTHAAHDLGHDCDFGVVLDDREVVYELIRIGQRGKIAQIEHIFDLDRLADCACDFLCVHLEHLIHAGADRSVSHDCYFYHCACSFPWGICCSFITRRREFRPCLRLRAALRGAAAPRPSISSHPCGPRS